MINKILPFQDIGIETHPIPASFLAGNDASLSCTVKVPENLDSPTVNWVKTDDSAVNASNFITAFDPDTGIASMTFTR